MKFSIAAILLSAASLASAEEFRVLVGQDGSLLYTPDQVTAKVGDQIHFEFRAKNHTVTQSSFAKPCTRRGDNATDELGIDSGFMPVAAGAQEIPVWTIEIKQDTSPIWMFCNQGDHCNKGMVFAINAPQDGEKSFSGWKEKAKTAKPEGNITPGSTPPNAPAPPSGSAPPAGSSAPAPSSDLAAPTGSNSASAPPQSAGASSSAPPTPASSGSAQPTSSAGTATPAADQANANVSLGPSSSNQPSGTLSAIRVPGAGIALTLAGLLAGMLL